MSQSVLVFSRTPESIFWRKKFGLIRLVFVGSSSVSTPVPSFVTSKVQLKSPAQGFRLGWGFLLGLSLIVLTMIGGPAAYFWVFPPSTVPQLAANAGTPLGGDFTAPPLPSISPEALPRALPPQDMTLPEGNWIMIPRIGVRTQILESALPDPSLEKGVWRVPEFAAPGDFNLPIIMAAHRYGYKWWWQNDYWKYHSFYKLPELEPGDLVEVIADHRKYLYEVYAGELATDISDYNADLILYTCKFLNAPQRYIKYARYIDPNVNTQDTKVGESTQFQPG